MGYLTHTKRTIGSRAKFAISCANENGTFTPGTEVVIKAAYHGTYTVTDADGNTIHGINDHDLIDVDAGIPHKLAAVARRISSFAANLS